jgi:hypothetical protein
LNPLEYTVKRLQAFLEEIRRLSTSEFPYGHSEEALRELKKKVTVQAASAMSRSMGNSDGAS